VTVTGVPAARAGVRRAGNCRQLREQLADELIDRAEPGGVQLTRGGKLLPELVKAVLERGLDAELTDGRTGGGGG